MAPLTDDERDDLLREIRDSTRSFDQWRREVAEPAIIQTWKTRDAVRDMQAEQRANWSTFKTATTVLSLLVAVIAIYVTVAVATGN